MTTTTRGHFKWAGVAIGVAMVLVAAAQTPETLPPAERGLHSQVFLEMRQDSTQSTPPAGGGGTKGGPTKDGRTSVTGSKGNDGPKFAPPQRGDTFLGLTLWKMVLASANSQVKSRGFTHPKDDVSGTKDWTSERILLGKPVRENDFVQFTFESAPQGYLYVIDRDAFSDGSFGEPVLIFPTDRIRNGRNEVEPGHPVQIPDPKDHPPALQVDPAKPGQTGIQLIVIATPQKIPELQSAADQQKIPTSWLERWQKQWATNVELTTDSKLDGLAVTLAEQAAILDLNHPLGPKDSAPTALFHRRGPPGQPIYVTATLPLEAAAKKP